MYGFVGEGAARDGAWGERYTTPVERGWTKGTVRSYARGAGVALALIGIAGLAGWMDFIRPSGDLLHLTTGVLLAYMGFGRSRASATRTVVLVVGSLYLFVGMLNPVTALLDALPIEFYRNGEDVAHVVFGLLSAFAALLLPGEGDPPADGARGAAL